MSHGLIQGILRLLAQFSQHVLEAFARLAGKDALWRRAVAAEHVGGEIDAALGGMHRQCPHQSGKAESLSGGLAGRLKGRPPRADDLSRQGEQGSSGVAQIGFERLPIRHDPLGDIEMACPDERLYARGRKRAAAQRFAESIGNGVSGSLALPGALDRLAPPLQLYETEAGLAHLLGDAGQLHIEGIESEEVGACVGRREQDSEATVGIASAGDAPYGVASLGLMQGPGLSVQARAAASPLLLADAGATLKASRFTPRISCIGDATKIEAVSYT